MRVLRMIDTANANVNVGIIGIKLHNDNKYDD